MTAQTQLSDLRLRLIDVIKVARNYQKFQELDGEWRAKCELRHVADEIEIALKVIRDDRIRDITRAMRDQAVYMTTFLIEKVEQTAPDLDISLIVDIRDNINLYADRIDASLDIKGEFVKVLAEMKELHDRYLALGTGISWFSWVMVFTSFFYKLYTPEMHDDGPGSAKGIG